MMTMKISLSLFSLSSPRNCRELTMGTRHFNCRAPISQLLPSHRPSSKPPSLHPQTVNPPPSVSRTKNPSSRRLFLLSLPARALLLAAATNDAANVLHCYALEGFDPVSPDERSASAAKSLRVAEAVGLLEKGRELQAQGDFGKALFYFTQVIEGYKDFALSEYARVGRALALYEVGDREEAIAEMEDVAISLKGYPEVHAALAAALYVDKHALLLAENQFTIATLLDPHYTDLSYVKETKHWPPSLVSSLQQFITLT
ncbi:uncharacterized protein LOC115726494 [Rhodamnia argentea]|uniref:Uncharacterized protein LOC115726494 n=1 Tax=Rhodamnia argentea TaxID=178133 RepID=A0A8B8MNT1_9MYRT|nr:uncharacterized protein LOC115726494 [Rhodamnia argentea]